MRGRSLKHNGFTLLEILLVIGIAAVLALAALMVYGNSRDASRAKQEKDAVVQVAGNIKTAFLGSDYASLTTGVANQARVFPGRMNEENYSPAQPITSAWGAVDVGPSPATNRRFLITYHQVPKDLCRHFVSFLATAFERVDVDGEPVRNLYSDPHLEFSMPTAIERCVDAGAADGAVDITIETD